MADLVIPGSASAGRLGHFLPYLLRRRLLDVVWPDESGERTIILLLLAMMVAYGFGLSVLLTYNSPDTSNLLPQLKVTLNATWLASALLVDFLPSLRPVTRVVPEHFPVSARWNVVAAFLLNFITLRRLLVITALCTAVVAAPRNAQVPGFSLLLVFGATMFSFNLRLLVTLRRWRHPLMLAHLASLGLMLWWLARPEASYTMPLGVGMAVLPWLLGAVQLYWLGPYFSARYLPDEAVPAAAPTASGQLLARLSPEHRAYFTKVWVLLLMGLVLKVALLGLTRWSLANDDGKLKNQSFFYLAMVPLAGFTYTNNNLFGFMRTLVANEIQRLGLTRRVLALYLRLVLPVVLIDCLLTAALLLGLFPRSLWPYLGLLPLGAGALTSLGLWGSLYQAKTVVKVVDFSSNKNASTLMSFATIGTAAGLYFLPWWWARIALALVITASAYWPIRAVLRNDGDLRRRLWRGIGA